MNVFSNTFYYTVIGALLILWLLVKYVFQLSETVSDTILIIEIVTAAVLVFGGKYYNKKKGK